MSDINAVTGMVAKSYLESTLKEESASKAVETTEKLYSTAIDLKAGLANGFEFWDQVIKGIKVLKAAKSFESTCDMFLEADAWLQGRRFP